MGNLDGKKRNIIFIVLLVISIGYILIANQVGNDQDTKFLNDYQEYQTATNLTNQQKYNDAQPLLSDLVTKYKNSYVILWQYAICLEGLGNYPESEKYYNLTEKYRPFVVKNQYFLVQKGKVLIQLGKYEEAKKYLLYSKKINESSDLTSITDQLLQEVDKKS